MAVQWYVRPDSFTPTSAPSVNPAASIDVIAPPAAAPASPGTFARPFMVAVARTAGRFP
jgi:hypothetical protein